MAKAIIQAAWENGIREFDTAQAYGTSEEILGQSLSELKLTEHARIITKFHPDLNHLNEDVLSRSLDKSLKKLRINRLYGIMLHREEMLSFWHKGLAEILFKIASSGKIEKIGISIYSPEKAIEALNTDGLEVLQVPTNVLDRRFEKAGVFELAAQKKKQIYVRSIFLQGLLLMNLEQIPAPMAFARSIIEKLEELACDLRLTRQELALGYIKEAMPGVKVIIGVDHPSHIEDNCIFWEKKPPQSLIFRIRNLFEQIDEQIINPVLWSPKS
jgi:aryl-alcohol dehydrogenase-like predicted oxidoreductase